MYLTGSSGESKTSKTRSKEQKSEGSLFQKQDTEKKRIAHVAPSNTSGLICKRRRTEVHHSEADILQMLRQQSPISEKKATNVCSTTTRSTALGSLVVHAWAQRERLGKTSYLDAVLRAMERHPLNLRVQIEGCRALRYHTKATGLLESKGVSVVLAALRNHTNSLLRYLAVDCIQPLSRDANSRMLFAQHPGYLKTFLNALQGSPEHVKLQELGLTMLSYLVEDPACRREIIDQGGLDVIISAMSLHTTNSLIHCNGAAALCWLVHLERQVAKDAITSYPDAIRTICGIGKSFVDNASVFGNCMCILFGVCVGDRSMLDRHPELGGAPTRHLIQLGMRHNPNVIKVQRNCMLLLHLITGSMRESAEMKDEEIKSYEECIDAILYGMKAFSKEADIQYLGCRILANLAGNPLLRRRLTAKSGCIKQVVSALMDHRADDRVQSGAVCFLRTLLHPDNNDDDRGGTGAFGGELSVLQTILESITSARALAR